MIVEWVTDNRSNRGYAGSIGSCRQCKRQSMLWYQRHKQGWRLYDPQIGPDISKLYIDLDKPHVCYQALRGYSAQRAKRDKKRIKST